MLGVLGILVPAASPTDVVSATKTAPYSQRDAPPFPIGRFSEGINHTYLYVGQETDRSRLKTSVSVNCSQPHVQTVCTSNKISRWFRRRFSTRYNERCSKQANLPPTIIDPVGPS